MRSKLGCRARAQPKSHACKVQHLPHDAEALPKHGRLTCCRSWQQHFHQRPLEALVKVKWVPHRLGVSAASVLIPAACCDFVRLCLVSMMAADALPRLTVAAALMKLLTVVPFPTLVCYSDMMTPSPASKLPGLINQWSEQPYTLCTYVRSVTTTPV